MSLTSLYEANLQYTRNDITSTETCMKGCLRVMPPGKKSRTKVAVGDQTGVAMVFGVGKHHEIKVDFKTPAEEKGIGAMDLYGDQIFVAAGSRVSAYTKKGRPFFALETNMSETIQTLRVDTPYLFIGGDYVITHFQESTELGYFMAPDRVHATLHRKTASETDFDVYCGCQDRTIRTLRNGVNQGAEAPCESAVQCLAYSVHTDQPSVTDLIYGTLSGSVGGFGVGSKNELIRKFTFLPEQRIGGSVSLATCDITKDGYSDIVVGRDDGTVELYSYNKNPDGTPVSVWTDNVGECVYTVDTGCVTNAARDEIVLHTYTGKVLSFTVCETDAKMQAVVPQQMSGPQMDLKSTAQAAAEAPPPPIAQYDAEAAPKAQILEKKEIETQQEIHHLKEAIRLKKAEFAQLSAGNRITTHQALEVSEHNMRAITSNFNVRDLMSVDDNGVISISIEVDTEIDSVAVQADVDVELIDYGDTGSHAIVLPSKTMIPSNTTKFCAVTHCVDGVTNKVILRFRSMEGQQGTIRCFVVPKKSPRSAQMRQFPIRSLSLHQRADVGDTDALPLSSIKIEGNFSAKDVHSWIYQSLPDVPQKFSSDTGEGRLSFRNTFLGTVLVARYKKGEVEFLSENMTTLALLKEYVTKEATQRKIAVNMSSRLHPESVLRTVQLLHPLVDYQFGLLQKQSIIEALREIESQEQSANFMSDDYKNVLSHAADIENESKRQPKRADYLRHLALRLLKDIAAFKGETVPPAKEQHLSQLLSDRYDGQALMDLILS